MEEIQALNWYHEDGGLYFDFECPSCGCFNNRSYFAEKPSGDASSMETCDECGTEVIVIF